MTAVMRALAGLFLLVLVSIGPSTVSNVAYKPGGETSQTLYVFGTLVEVVTFGVAETDAQSALVETGHLFQRLHKDWHAWRPGTLHSLNMALAEGRGFTVDDELAGVLAEGQRLACESGGLFDPGIGALVSLWGFHGDLPPTGAPPDDDDIQAIQAAEPSIANLHLEGTLVSSTNSEVRLDLGAYAKGAALELAADQLAQEGIHDFILNAGGDVLARGRHGERPWRVAIRNPFDWGAIAAVSLSPGEALFTSGNYERFLAHEGARFSHILDPRTGSPVAGVVSATVLDTDAMRADAAATALSVAGVEEWAEVAQLMDLEAALLITDDGRLLATPEMADRLEPVAGRPWTVPLEVTLPAETRSAPPSCGT